MAGSTSGKAGSKSLNLTDVQQALKIPLKNAFIAKSFEPVCTAYQKLITSETDNSKTVLDHVLRDYMTEELLRNASNNPDLDKLELLVAFSIEGAIKELCSAMNPIVLMSDMFDCLTLEHCQQLFKCVESNVNTWKEPTFFQPCKNNLLRMCNDLLRRLSRTQNTVFCGQILLFLAKFFPFSERSGLNVISEFNLDNKTVYSEESDVEKNGNGSEAMEVDGEIKAIKIEEDEKNMNIDYNLYCKFWQLQDYFRDPDQCYEKVKWKTFQSYSNDVLGTFQSFKLDAISGKKKATEKAVAASESEQYFAKYLTNQNLLQLQLSDSNFRRYILVQFLILFQYLQSSVKFKSDKQILSDEQTKWMTTTSTRLYDLMKETPPNGERFAQSVQHILKREEQWNAWKNAGCPSFAAKKGQDEPESPKKSIGSTRKRKRKLGDQVQEAMQNKKFLMGNPQLTRLWNLYPDNMDACAAPERDFLPSLDAYFTEAMEQLDPAAQVEDTYKKVNDGQWGWRALRLLAKKSPHFFTYGNNPIAKLPDYLEQMLKKMSKEQLLTVVKTEGGDEAMDKPEEELGGSEEEEKGNESGNGDSNSASAICSEKQLEEIAAKLGENWIKLIPKLGQTNEEIVKYKEEKSEEKDRAFLMLKKWLDDEGEAATTDELMYILEGQKMKKVAEGIL